MNIAIKVHKRCADGDVEICYIKSVDRNDGTIRTTSNLSEAGRFNRKESERLMDRLQRDEAILKAVVA